MKCQVKTVLEKALQEGRTVQDVADEFRVKRRTVQRWAQKHSVQLPAPKQKTLPCSEEHFRVLIQNNFTIAGVLRDLDRARVGSNYKFVWREIRRLGLDTSHWKGLAHGTTDPQKVSWEEVLVQHSTYRITSGRKQRLLQEGLLPNTCALCKGRPEWQGQPLILRLDHINGIRNDNRIENLRMVCPNCDSQLPTYCGKNKKLLQPHTRPLSHCLDCGDPIGPSSLRCLKCAPKAQIKTTKILWPTNEVLIESLSRMSYRALGRQLGVSDNAIRKRIRSQGLASTIAGLKKP